MQAVPTEDISRKLHSSRQSLTRFYSQHGLQLAQIKNTHENITPLGQIFIFKNPNKIWVESFLLIVK